MDTGGAQEAGPRIDEHFDHIRANLIRCEECSENFFFDFLRHPRYFVTHFKTCHLKNVLYRFNGCSEEGNQRVRFGPRRKKDATAWFGQLKSTEKRMISMQDNKWGEIAERECWSCRLCKGARKTSDLPHAFEPNEQGRRQALLHLRQFHGAAYNAFLRMLPAVDSSRSPHRASGNVAAQRQRLPVDSAEGSSGQAARSLILQAGGTIVGSVTSPAVVSGGQSLIPSHEAERSRIRRMRASAEAKKAEAERSRRRRAQLTPAQRQVDAERRVRKRHRIEERARNRLRRADASPETKAREMQRSRERRQNATEQQRRREAQRSRLRRQNASEEQRVRERERCRRRYEVKKQQKLSTQQTEETFEPGVNPPAPATSISDTTMPPSSGASDLAYATQPPPPSPPRSHLLPVGLEQRSQQLQQQQAGVRLQLQSLYDSLAPNSQVEL